MNRRGFVSLIVGAAGAPFVPWRGLVSPTIILPAEPEWAWVTGLEALELSIPHDWYSGRGFRINTDERMIRADFLAVCREAYAKRMAFVQSLTRGKGIAVQLGQRL